MEGIVASHRIRCLPAALSNQIAAGEVVERPASVVKELLENSLDAGARDIRADVEQGGARLIRVHDDGCGIHADDLSLSLSRHATSKIARLSDLVAVRTLGFRGEALPSIASVSRLTLTSRTADAELGCRVFAEGGAVPSRPEPAPHPTGTTVEVRDLFFNVPARRKFLRTERTEFRHLDDLMRRLALSRFDAGFVLRHNGRNVLALRPATTPEERARRVARVCGNSFVQHAVAVDFEAAGLHLGGWVAVADFSRGQSDLQYFFVNGRIVRDRLVTHAVRQAYGGSVPQGRYPAYALYLSVDAAAVDVNVHPTKHELRFRESRLVHDFIRRGLLTALMEAAGGDAAAGKSAVQSLAPLASSRLEVQESSEGYRTSSGPGYSGSYPSRRGGRRSEPELDASPLGRALGRLGDAYIIAENGKSLILVEIVTARERVLRTQLARAFDARTIVSQPLLVPLSVNVGKERAEIAERWESILEELGFDLSRTGPDFISVRQIPASLAHADVTEMVQDILWGLRLLKDRRDHEGVRQVLDQMARHGAESEVPPLDMSGMNVLLRALEDADEDPGSDGGRPAAVHITLEELGGRFAQKR